MAQIRILYNEPSPKPQTLNKEAMLAKHLYFTLGVSQPYHIQHPVLQ